GGMPGGVGGLWSATVRSRCRASCVRAEDRDALMFDPAAPEPPGGAPLVGRGVPAANGPAVSLPPVDLEASAAELVDQITAREDAKDAIAADQTRLMVALDQRMRAERAAKGVPATRQGEGIAKQVGLARRESPNQGALLLGRAKVLVNQMPHTLTALGSGYLNERRAAILVTETDCLTPEHRAAVDQELAGNPERLQGMGNRRLEAEAKRAAYRLDARAVVGRAAKAEADRYVSSRPEPDVMVSVRTLLPVAQGVAVMAALHREADRLANAGDPRTRGQVM